MTSRTIRTFLALATLLAALPALAASVYQWKDAKGVTHYSDAPPPDRKGVQNRQLKDGPGAPAEQAGEPAEDPNCVIARKNLLQLKDARPVGQDANGDGKPDSYMTAEERAQQVKKTEQMLKEFCDKPAQA
jgi:uncharacterized protein DUF4124